MTKMWCGLDISVFSGSDVILMVMSPKHYKMSCALFCAQYYMSQLSKTDNIDDCCYHSAMTFFFSDIPPHQLHLAP